MPGSSVLAFFHKEEPVILRASIALALVLATAALPACRRAGTEEEAAAPVDTVAATSEAPVIDVTAVDYAFQAPPEIASGWTTFRLRNTGAEPHFFLLTRLPEGKTIEEYGQEVGVAFDDVWKELRAGSIDKSEAGRQLGERLPEWYLTSAAPMGGVGLVRPGGIGETTVNLEPGYYVMECYVKTAEGQFHAGLGMVRPLVVTGQPSGGSPPDADVEVTLSNDGIEAPATLAAGHHTIAVHYTEHPPYGLGNDVHLAKLEDASPEQVTGWMDWMEQGGLESPAPAPFMGGAEEGPAGTTSYFSVDVDPGRYLWVTETDPGRGMAKEVTVP